MKETRRIPGLAREYVASQRLGTAPAPMTRLLEEHQDAPIEFKAGSCGRCSCTEDRACEDQLFGDGCFWVKEPTDTEAGICSSCATPDEIAAAGLGLMM